MPFLEKYFVKLKAAGLFNGNAYSESGTFVDLEIRERLQKALLQDMLDVQEKERQKVHKKPRQCLFCFEFSSCLKDLFTHMYKEHGFNIGLLDNIVMVDEYLKSLEGILMQRVCIFCHCQFKTLGCLRKHMKNKRHYRIDPKNIFYDKFYISNYLKNQGGKDEAEDPAGEKDAHEDEENNWDDLVEDVDLRTNCLFCSSVFADPGEELQKHLLNDHGFDLDQVRRGFGKDSFYDYIKLITYLRNQMKDLHCPACDQEFDEQEALEEHLQKERHCLVPRKSLWDQPQFLFPIFDDDPLLFDFGEFDDDDT